MPLLFLTSLSKDHSCVLRKKFLFQNEQFPRISKQIILYQKYSHLLLKAFALTPNPAGPLSAPPARPTARPSSADSCSCANPAPKLPGFVLNRLPTGRAASYYHYYYGDKHEKDSAYGSATRSHFFAAVSIPKSHSMVKEYPPATKGGGLFFSIHQPFLGT